MVPLFLKGEWKCVSTTPGEQSVMMDGMPLELKSFAGSLDLVQQVQKSCSKVYKIL